MIKKSALSFVLLFIATVLFSQTIKVKVLTFTEFIQIVKQNHPVAKQAELKIEFGEAYMQKSRGLFDPKAFSEVSQKYFNENQYYSTTNSGLKVPTWFGLEFNGGYEQNQGHYLNLQNNNPNAGLWYAGVTLPIGQGFFIDKRRAELRKAQLYVESTQAERQALYNELLYEAGKFYWDWFNSYNTLKVYEEAISLAEERFKSVKQGSVFGDLPLIDTVEASIQLQNRMLNYQQALLNYNNSTAMLSVYLWDNGIVPLEISDETVPMSTSSINLETITGQIIFQLDSLEKNHPDLVQYNYKLQQLKVEKRLKQEMLKPKLNLKYNAITEPMGNDVFSDYTLNNYKWGLEFSMPLFLRKERGDVKITKLKINDTQYTYGAKVASLTYKAKASINELETSFTQAKLYAKTVLNYELLLNGEKKKFESGESSLFMVNSRELGYINTQLKYIELIAKNQKAKIAAEYALGVLSVN